MSERLAALGRAVEQAPNDHSLRLLFAEELAAAHELAASVEQYERLAMANVLSADELVSGARVAVDAVDVAAASRLLDAARAAGAVSGISELQAEVDALVGLAGIVVDLDLPRPPCFADVGGLERAKATLGMTIVEPLRDPDRFRAFGRSVGGGVLLYGPPGCGKSLLAAATAAEAGCAFVEIELTDVLKPFLGESERALSDAFDDARRLAPCVLILDEIEAIGYSRSRTSASHGLVDQLMRELDHRDGLAIVGTTNAPWRVDDAVARAGRFDSMFVGPPDEPARRRILEIHLEDRPVGALDLDDVAARTRLFSGADLASLVVRAVDEALLARSDSIEQRHLIEALRYARPTTLDWVARARRYVEFANEDGRWDEISAFVTSPAARR